MIILSEMESLFPSVQVLFYLVLWSDTGWNCYNRDYIADRVCNWYPFCLLLLLLKNINSPQPVRGQIDNSKSRKLFFFYDSHL